MGPNIYRNKKKLAFILPKRFRIIESLASPIDSRDTYFLLWFLTGKVNQTWNWASESLQLNREVSHIEKQLKGREESERDHMKDGNRLG